LASAVGGRTLEVFADTPRLNQWIHSRLAPHIRGDVLEIGSGIGNLSRLIVGGAAADARVVLSDVEPPYLDALERAFVGDPRVVVAHYDLDRPPPPEIAGHSFDTVVAVNVIEHIEDDAALVAILASVLRPGGRLVVYVPAGPFAYGTMDQALGHYRRYDRTTLARLLSDAGLDVETPRYINLLGLVGWTINGRVLRRKQLSRFQIGAFERLVPILRIEDRVRLPIGLGLCASAAKRG
jgi:SAM-dependent methyltransferase